MADGPNEVLTSLLDELGWSPRALDRRINHVFGGGTVADTAPYHWRASGCTPRPPLPELAQRLDGAHGGGAYLPYVGAQFRAVALLLRQGGHPARVEMAAHVLADLAFQAATREHSGDAIALGQAAVRIAAVSPAGVRALVQTRLAYGHALAGQLDDCERAHATGLDTIADRDPTEMDHLFLPTLDAVTRQPRPA